jgi:TatD DNase family protein
MIFESHAHYDDKKFSKDRDILLTSMKAANVGCIINVGADLKTTKKSIELSQQYDFIYAAIGVHPSEISCLSEEGIEWLRAQAAIKKVVAIGEIGLDYYWEKDPSGQQEQVLWFKRLLQLAKEVDLPVIIHSREAAEDTMTIMKENAAELRGIIHCFSYSLEMAMEYVKMGYYIGIGGVITFQNAKKLKEVVAAIPIEHIVVETDCPYLSPEPYRGQRNSSLYLPYIIEKIAEIKGMTPKEVEDITYNNGKNIYCI